jgi:hypothetical protein
VGPDTGAMPTPACGDDDDDDGDDGDDAGTVAVDVVCLGGSRRLVRKGWRATCFKVCVETRERIETRSGRKKQREKRERKGEKRERERERKRGKRGEMEKSGTRQRCNMHHR